MTNSYCGLVHAHSHAHARSSHLHGSPLLSHQHYAPPSPPLGFLQLQTQAQHIKFVVELYDKCHETTQQYISFLQVCFFSACRCCMLLVGFGM